MSRIELVGRMKVRVGILELFKQQAVECIRHAAAKHVGTLAYDWFLSRDRRSCEARGLYAALQLVRLTATLGAVSRGSAV